MKRKDIVEVLFPGVFIGLILGFSLTMLVGVNETDMVPNIIGGIMCCFIPTLLNTTNHNGIILAKAKPGKIVLQSVISSARTVR